MRQSKDTAKVIVNIFDLILDREKTVSLGEVFHKAVEGGWVSAVGIETTVRATAATRLRLSCRNPAGIAEMRPPKRTHTAQTSVSDRAVCNRALKLSKSGLVIVWSVPVRVHLLAKRKVELSFSLVQNSTNQLLFLKAQITRNLKRNFDIFQPGS